MTNSIEGFKQALRDTDWNFLYDLLEANSGPSVAYDYFNSTFVNIFDKYFPESEVKQSNRLTARHPWITKGLMKSCVKKSKLYRKYCKNRSKNNKDKYITYRNKLNCLLHKAEKSYYKDKFKLVSGNIRETWKLLDSIFNKNSGNVSMQTFKVDGVDLVNKQETVNRFNDYFVSIDSKLASLIPNSLLTFPITSSRLT